MHSWTEFLSREAAADPPIENKFYVPALLQPISLISNRNWHLADILEGQVRDETGPLGQR